MSSVGDDTDAFSTLIRVERPYTLHVRTKSVALLSIQHTGVQFGGAISRFSHLPFIRWGGVLMAETKHRWRREILTYFCFTLPYAFAPIGCLYLARATNGDRLDMPGLVADGGILAIAIGLNADAFSRMIAGGTKWPELRIVLAAFASLTMGSGSFFYGLRYSRRATDSVVFVNLCFVVFVVSVALAIFCRFLPEDNQ